MAFPLNDKTRAFVKTRPTETQREAALWLLHIIEHCSKGDHDDPGVFRFIGDDTIHYANYCSQCGKALRRMDN